MQHGVSHQNESHLQGETRERQGETSKLHVREAHSVLITVILLPQRLSCYGGKMVSTAHAQQS
jgi:hypothetical protein